MRSRFRCGRIIGRIIQTPATVLIRRVDPFVADDGEEGVTFADHLLDVFGEIHAEGNIFDILEDVALAEVSNEAFMNPAGHVGTIAPPIGNEDAVGAWGR